MSTTTTPPPPPPPTTTTTTTTINISQDCFWSLTKFVKCLLFGCLSIEFNRSVSLFLHHVKFAFKRSKFTRVKSLFLLRSGCLSLYVCLYLSLCLTFYLLCHFIELCIYLSVYLPISNYRSLTEKKLIEKMGI